MTSCRALFLLKITTLLLLLASLAKAQTEGSSEANMPNEERSDSGSVLSPDSGYCLGSNCDFAGNNLADNDYADLKQEINSGTGLLTDIKTEHQAWKSGERETHTGNIHAIDKEKQKNNVEAKKESRLAQVACTQPSGGETAGPPRPEEIKSCRHKAKMQLRQKQKEIEKAHENKLAEEYKRHCDAWDAVRKQSEDKSRAWQKKCDELKQIPIKLRECMKEAFTRVGKNAADYAQNKVGDEVSNSSETSVSTRPQGPGGKIYSHAEMLEDFHDALIELSKITAGKIDCEQENQAKQELMNSPEKWEPCKLAHQYRNHMAPAEGISQGPRCSYVSVPFPP